MQTISFLITIVKKSQTEICTSYLAERGIISTLSLTGRGTASDSVLDYLGIENTEKSIIISFVPSMAVKELTIGISALMKLYLPGNGIALSIPVSKASGIITQRIIDLHSSLTESSPQPTISENGDKTIMNVPYELIFAISETGCSDLVMEAAREGGATGGTIIHAKRTGAENVHKFFGVSIAEEKEMILIVAESSKTTAIMKSIMSSAGASSEAKTIVFSLPVTEAIGLR